MFSLKNNILINKMSYVNLISPAQFFDIRKKNKVVIIDCWADWCGPCKAISPQFEDLAHKYKDINGMQFVKHNIDVSKDVPYMNKVESIPCFFVYSYDSDTCRQFKGNEFNKLTNLVNLIAEKLS